MASPLRSLAGLAPRGPRTVLEIDLSQGVVTNPPATPWEALRLRQAPSLRALREGLARAVEDDAVLGLQVHLGTCPLSLATADEVGDLIEEFGRHKPTLAWTESFGELSSGLAAYRVAVRAKQIWLQPTGALGLTGVALAITLLRGGFEKLGIEPQFGQRHEYKSAADQFAATEVTPAVREMVQRIADSLVDDTVALVARRRGLQPAQVREAMAQGPLTAEAARAAGLIDHAGYRDEVQTWAHEAWTPAWEPRFVHRYASDAAGNARTVAGIARRSLPGSRSTTVGVVDVTGPIVLGPGSARQAGSERVCARLRALRADDDVAAVLLRVDSPGGSAAASDAIRREVLALREAGRPVVAQMGSVAASGGYFVAMPADEIVAQPTTLTGSIGVLAGKLVLQGLLDRVGIVRESVVAGGPRAGMMSPERPFSDDDRAVLEAWLDEIYLDFTSKAAADRGLPLEQLQASARGRVWTGADAAERSLIDHLGGTRLALERLAALAGTSTDRLRLRSGGGPFEVLKQLRPAESSDDLAASLPMSLTGGASALLGAGPEALLATWAEHAGLALPTGVLTLPWRLSVG